MNEVGINLRVSEDLSSTVPRAVNALNQLEKGFQSVMDRASQAGEAFEQWNEQLRAVHTAQAVNQATRPLAPGTILDQSGRPMNQGGGQQQNPFQVNGRNVFLQMREDFKSMIDVLKDVLQEVSSDRAPVPSNGNTPEGPGDGGQGQGKSKFRKEYDSQQEARKVLKDTDRVRQVISGFASGNPMAPIQSIGSDVAGGKLVEMWGGLSGLAKGGIIGGLVAGAAAMGVNALTEQYQRVMRPAMDNAAMMGTVGNVLADGRTPDEKANSRAVHNAMSIASQKASAYGYTIEDGFSLQKEYAKAAGRGYSEQGFGNIFSYARGYGLNPSELGKIQGMGARFGAGNALGYVSGGLGQSGMSPAQFQEYMAGTMNVFEEGLSRGIVRGFGDITGTQNLLAGMGETWRGDLGARKFSTLNDAIVSGANLSSEEDVIKYRAAMAVTGSNDLISNQMRLERGFDKDMFRAIGQEVDSFSGGDRTASIQLYRQIYGTSVTDSATLYDYFKSGKFEEAMAKIGGAPNLQSNEMKLLTATEEMNQSVRDIAHAFLPAKTAIVQAISSVPQTIAQLFGLDLDSQRNAELAPSDGQVRSEISGYERTIRANPRLNSNALMAAYEKAARSQATAPGDYDAAKRVMGFLGQDFGFAEQAFLMDNQWYDYANGSASWVQKNARMNELKQRMAKENINGPIGTTRDTRRNLWGLADDRGGTDSTRYDLVDTILRDRESSALNSRLGGMSKNTFNALVDNNAWYGLYGDVMKATAGNSDGRGTITAKEMADILTKLVMSLPAAMRGQAAQELNIQINTMPTTNVAPTRGPTR